VAVTRWRSRAVVLEVHMTNHISLNVPFYHAILAVLAQFYLIPIIDGRLRPSDTQGTPPDIERVRQKAVSSGDLRNSAIG